MKVNSVGTNLSYLSRIQDAKSDPDGRSRQQDQQPKRDEKEKKEFSEELEQSEKNLESALESFRKDEHTRAQGLSVTTSGAGPGLKVVLKDTNGAVVRQFTGEEFVRLRAAAPHDGKARGKLLDRKF